MSNEEAIVSDAPAPGEAEIDFETWAALSARQLKLDQEARFDLLEEREIDPAAYARAEERWVMALSDDLSAERMDRVDLYAACCAAEMQRRKETKQETADVVALAPAPIKAPEAPATVPAKEVAVPFVAPEVAFFAVEPPGVLVSPPPVLVSPPPVLRAPSPLAGTMMTSEPLQGARAAATALPFGNAPSARFVAEMSAPRPGAPEAKVGGETLPLGVDLLGAMRQELPFKKSAAPSPAPVAAWPRLTLDTYASLCAELSVFPERGPDILKKYGIADEAGLRAVDREWAERLSTHPETQDLWQRKVGEFRAWLLRGGR
jgi:hypothetical protein